MDAGADAKCVYQATLTARANSYEWYLSSDLTSVINNNPYHLIGYYK